MGWRIWPDLAGGGGVGSWWCGLWFVVDGWWLLERARDTLSPHLVFCSLSPHFVGRNEDEDDPSAFRPLSILSPRPLRQLNFVYALSLGAMLCYILTHKHTSFARRAGLLSALGAIALSVTAQPSFEYACACHQQHQASAGYSRFGRRLRCPSADHRGTRASSEPASLVLRAPSDVAQVVLKPSDLKGKADVIPASALDLKPVKVWCRPRAWHSYFADSATTTYIP